MGKKDSVIISFLLMVMASLVAPVNAEGTTSIDIFVVDAISGNPLPGSTVIFVDDDNISKQVANVDGHCRFMAISDKWYNILVFSDNSTTPGRDYVPSVFTAYLPEVSVTWMCKLLPGATILLVDDAHFLEASEAGSYFLFTVVNATSNDPISLTNSLVNYGYGFPSWGDITWRGENWQPVVLDLDSREIIVPANMRVAIDVKTIAGNLREGVYSNEFSLDNDGEYYILSQGELVEDSLSKYSVQGNFPRAEAILDSVNETVSGAMDTGFFLSLERRELTRARGLIDAARNFYQKSDYYVAHSYLREAYVTISNVESYVETLMEEAQATSAFAPGFFTLMAVILGFFFSEKPRRRLAASLVVLVIFLVIFFVFFPSGTLNSHLIDSSLAVITVLILHSIIPLLFSLRSEREDFVVQQPPTSTLIWSIFSIAKRNLKRKRLRSLLLSTNLSVLVFAFIVLTSVSSGSGVLSLIQHGKYSPTQGILVRSFSSLQNPTTPLPSSFIDWLYNRPEVYVAAPKLESTPKLVSQTNLTSLNGKSIMIFGILGIIPSLEKNFTSIQNAIVSGRFLEDNMTDAIMVSSKAAERLGVEVGDSLIAYNSSFELVAIFSDERIANTIDFDGTSVLPQKLATAPFVGLIARECASDEVFITNINTAMLLPSIVISSVDVKLNEEEDIMAFSRLIVLTKGYDVWAATVNGIYLVRIGQFLQSGGLFSVLPLLAIVLLAVALHFLGVARERKDEILSMSSLGVNPTHTMIVFIAEAIIVGLISGGIGYLGALSSYRILSFMSADLMVRQKISVSWGILGILLTTSVATLASIIPAMRASAAVTPSLRRRWSVKAQGKETLDGTWIFTMPFKIPASTIRFFIDFLERRLKARSGKLSDRIQNLYTYVEEKPDYSQTTIQFRYISGEIEGEGFTIDNQIDLVKERESEEYSIYLRSRLVYLNIKAESRIYENISFLRRLILEWATLSLKIVTPEGHSLSHLYTIAKSLHPTTINLLVFTEKSKEKIQKLSHRLHQEGEPIPQFNLFRVNDPQNLDEGFVKVAESLKEKDVNLVCVNGGPENICSLLAIEAKKRDITVCCISDNRSMSAQRRNPFEVGQVIKID